MYIHLELDKWAYDVERQLIEGRYEAGERPKLQKKLLALQRIQEKFYRVVYEKYRDIPYSCHINTPPKYCSNRRLKTDQKEEQSEKA